MKWNKKMTNSKKLYPHLSPRIIFQGELQTLDKH